MTGIKRFCFLLYSLCNVRYECATVTRGVWRQKGCRRRTCASRQWRLCGGWRGRVLSTLPHIVYHKHYIYERHTKCLGRNTIYNITKPEQIMGKDSLAIQRHENRPAFGIYVILTTYYPHTLMQDDVLLAGLYDYK